MSYRLISPNGQGVISRTPGTLGGHKNMKIYGRLDCKSANRAIGRGHYVTRRVFFADEKAAVANGYRPCAKCLVEKYKEWKTTR